jgi:hypothetical protein
VYNGAPEWRSYFRSARAHNTAVVNGRDQAEQAGTFRWNTRWNCRVLNTGESIQAEHDGYPGVTHRRRVEALGAEGWMVSDEFLGSGEHNFEINYHFAEGAGMLIGVSSSLPMTPAMSGDWVSHRYGETRPTSTLRLTRAGRAPASVVTILTVAGRPLEIPLSAMAGQVQWLRVDGGVLKQLTEEKNPCAQSVAS